MIFFSKKPKQEEEMKKIKKAVEAKDIAREESESFPENFPEMPESMSEFTERIEPEMPERISRPEPIVSAPLFVKIEKYRNVLNTLNDLKTTVLMLKNALVVQKELERTRDENVNLIQLGINKIDKKLLALDAEFLRPRGYIEQLPTHMHESEGLEGAVDNLKSQIDDLKSELETV